MPSSMVFLGVHGNVIAVDRATGQQLWSVHLKGSDFVNLLVDDVRVLAATHGEVFCLHAESGQVLWHNPLPGQGWDIVTIATVQGTSAISPALSVEKKKRDDAANGAN